MRIGIIGLGSMGERHARNLQKLRPRDKIDILTSRARWDHADRRTLLFGSANDFFALPHDVFVITNETGLHAATIQRCLAGHPRGIFVEKPITRTFGEAKRIVKLLNQRRAVFMVGYSLQFFKPLIRLRSIVRSGTIGDVLSMRVSVGKDVRGWRPLDYRTRYSSDAKRGGGAILDYVHELNYPSWILGEPLRFVCGLWGRSHLKNIAAEDLAESIFVSRTGVVVSIHQDYLQTPGQRFCEIIGTRGTLTFSRILRRGSAENAIKIDLPDSSRILKVRAAGNEMFMDEMRFFLACLRSGKSFSNASEAAEDLRATELIKRRGRRLSFGVETAPVRRQLDTHGHPHP